MATTAFMPLTVLSDSGRFMLEKYAGLKSVKVGATTEETL
jgi:hypothetical protein